MCLKQNINCMKKILSASFFFLVASQGVPGQNILTLQDIFQQIDKSNPTTKMFDADIKAMDEAAKGAKSWMPPEFGAGFWMTPYQPKYWKSDDMGPGMGSFMLSAQQMFPNKQRQNAEASYMQAMSSVEKEKKKVTLNNLYAEAKKNYYQWLITQKKLKIID